MALNHCHQSELDDPSVADALRDRGRNGPQDPDLSVDAVRLVDRHNACSDSHIDRADHSHVEVETALLLKDSAYLDCPLPPDMRYPYSESTPRGDATHAVSRRFWQIVA